MRIIVLSGFTPLVSGEGSLVYFLVLISVALFAVSSILQNRTVKAGGDVMAVIIINNLPVGALLLVWCLLTKDLTSVSLQPGSYSLYHRL